MKLADYLCFFYIFFTEVIKITVLVTKQTKSEREHSMFVFIVSVNALYLVLWIALTNGKSFKKYPKEERRLAGHHTESLLIL